MPIIPGSIVTRSFSTQKLPGENWNADSLPVGTVRRNGTDTAETVTITNKAQGDYTFGFTVPASWNYGDSVEVLIAATVDSISSKRAVWSTTLERMQTLVVGPLVGTPVGATLVGSSIPLTINRLETKVFALSVLDADGDPVNLSAMDLRFTVETIAVTPVEVFSVSGFDIVVAGNGDEIATISVDDTDSDQTAGSYRWKLWDQITDQVLLFGKLSILPSVG